MSVVFRTSKLYNETEANYLSTNPEVKRALREFVKIKSQNPLASYGKRDYPFTGKGHLKGLMHAHLTHDLSIIYTVSGRDPHVISLYMVASHSDLGTSKGQPNTKKQAQIGKKLSQQEFNK
jgi:mRNA-degrading endonuclease YafQ of YafQ-DinJ toxin-antitoxin module